MAHKILQYPAPASCSSTPHHLPNMTDHVPRANLASLLSSNMPNMVLPQDLGTCYILYLECSCHRDIHISTSLFPGSYFSLLKCHLKEKIPRQPNLNFQPLPHKNTYPHISYLVLFFFILFNIIWHIMFLFACLPWIEWKLHESSNFASTLLSPISRIVSKHNKNWINIVWWMHE